VSLDIKTAEVIARQTLHAIGESSDGLSLVRATSAVVFATTNLIVRVSAPETPAEEAGAHLRISTYLQESGVAAAIPKLPTPFSIEGGTATVWLRETILDRGVEPETTGVAMARLHQLSTPSWLPPLDILAVTRRRVHALSCSESLSADELVLIDEKLRSSQELASAHALISNLRIVHGDIPGNLLATPRGGVFIDFENTGAGDPAWDLTRFLHSHSRFSGKDAASLDRVLNAYFEHGGNADLARAHALLGVVDLIGAVWTVSARSSSLPMEHESHVRMQWLQDDGSGPKWHAQ
jgi:aminoglycoside phosphotransferase (APT) family kinase protein